MNVNGWIIYNGHLAGNKFLDFAQWLQHSATNKKVSTIIYKNNELHSFLGNKLLGLIRHDAQPLPNFVIFTDKDIYLAKQLELMGIRVYNNAQSIEICDDKISTYQVLAQNKLPIPKTIIAPKVFVSSRFLDQRNFQQIIDTLGFPMILKEAFGSFGEQVFLVQNEKEMIQRVKELQGKAFVFQEFIQSSYGRDLRLHVVGDKVVAAMVRQSSSDFRANVSAGGTMQSYQPTQKEIEIAVSATKAIGADFAGVDLLFGMGNQPIICEINSNAHIRNMYDCTGVNVADYMIDYILTNVKKSLRGQS